VKRHIIPLGRIAGIPVGLDYSWFLIFALLTWMLANRYFPAESPHWAPPLYWLASAATSVLFFLSILLHELGHSAVALKYRVPVRGITLFVFGGVADIGAEPPSAKAELLIAIAGPAVSLALAALCYALQLMTAGVELAHGIAKYLALINLALAVFNMVPGYPLDGGRVLRAALWAVTGNLRRATMIAAAVGRGIGFLLIFFGVLRVFAGDLIGGLWTAFIGWFLESAAAGQMVQVVYREALAGHTVAQAMSGKCGAVAASLTLQQLIDEHILATGQRCFLVNRGDRTIGLMTLSNVKAVPRPAWAATTVERAMLPIAKTARVNPETALSAAMQAMARAGVNQLLVVSGDEVVGMLRREDTVNYLTTLLELGADGAARTSMSPRG